MIKSSDFIGLTKKSAQNKAEKDNLIFRLISIDGDPFLAYPDDTRSDRICVEINGGLVTKAFLR